MELKAYAKINWDLHVLGRRHDGFHALDTVMVNVSLFDTLTFEPSQTFEFTCSDPTLPTDDRNLVVKAAKALAIAAGVPCTGRVHLAKQIPAGGGMGGGSSDAATALRGLNQLWRLGWPVEELQPIAAQVGSDVAFFLYGGWCRCLGRGEIVQPLPGSKAWPAVRLLLLLPQLHVATPSVYKKLQYPVVTETAGRNLTEVFQTLEFNLVQLQKNEDSVNLGLINDLTDAAQLVEPRLDTLQRVLREKCAGRWLMSGSGAVHFVIPECSDDGSKLRVVLDRLGLGLRVLTATTFTPLTI
jgi:4-diphosphocytidyl-2C-methyl-D-erythritol kinase